MYAILVLPMENSKSPINIEDVKTLLASLSQFLDEHDKMYPTEQKHILSGSDAEYLLTGYVNACSIFDNLEQDSQETLKPLQTQAEKLVDAFHSRLITAMVESSQDNT